MELQEKCDERIFIKLPTKLKTEFIKEAKRQKVPGSVVVRALMQTFIEDGKNKRREGKSDSR